MAQTHTHSPASVLEKKAKTWNLDIDSIEYARRMDEEDPLRAFRSKFCIPKKSALKHADKSLMQSQEEECLYFSGHSLGLKPKSTDTIVNGMLRDWGQKGFECHFDGVCPTASSDQLPKLPMSRLIGAQPNEVAIMNSLSVNLHLMLSTFYKPSRERYKIIIEDHAFPTDLLAVESHLRLHGRCPESDLIVIRPKAGEYLIQEEDVLATIQAEGDSVALILFPGIQYYTGQLFNVKALTRAAHEKRIVVGVDLAHAVGNVKLEMHDWDVDFAVWCTYKYLNSGPGGIGALFVHDKFLNRMGNDDTFPMLKGWWGSHSTAQFLTAAGLNDSNGADMFRLSTPHAILNGMLWASLQIFTEATLDRLVDKQFLLTGYLEYLIKHSFNYNNLAPNDAHAAIVRIITPSNPSQRGSHLSLLFSGSLELVQDRLLKHGVVCDVRMPNVIRIAPIPLYTTYADVRAVVHILNDICQEIFDYKS